MVVLDLFSRCILGWKLAETMESDLVTAALRRAVDTNWSHDRPFSTPIAAVNTAPARRADCSNVWAGSKA